MIEPLLQLSDRDLQEVALALRSGRLVAPFGVLALRHVVSPQLAPDLSKAIGAMMSAGFGAETLAAALDLLRVDRSRRPRAEQVLELVTTGPEIEGRSTRDTSVVVRDLFANAKETVLAAGYTVYQGQRVFQALADRMLERPELRVRLFLDIQRGPGDTTSAPALVRRFADRFRKHQWPAERPLPEVYFDPRSLELDSSQRAALHAKVVVVDGHQVFVSSANFTEAAQLRNIEVGVAIQSPPIAQQLTAFFEALLRAGNLARVPLES
jgi:phosphatidylserine/phosphatidylglycerophosphate/cardiolipin synthase-like enzyme